MAEDHDEIALVSRLGDLCNGHPEHVDAALPQVLDALRGADNDDLLVAVAQALGRMWDPRCLEPLLGLVDHTSTDVRLAVTQALGGAMCNNETDAGLTALIRRTRDEDGDIRDWATFTLAQQDSDTEELREALWARINDDAGATRGEALVGLAHRKDPRARDEILRRLSHDPGNLIVEAAAELEDPALYPELLRLKNEGWQDREPRPTVLDDALEACRPAS